MSFILEVYWNINQQVGFSTCSINRSQQVGGHSGAHTDSHSKKPTLDDMTWHQGCMGNVGVTHGMVAEEGDGPNDDD